MARATLRATPSVDGDSPRGEGGVPTAVGTSAGDPQFNPILIMAGNGVPLGDVAAVTEFWLQRVFQNFYTLAERELAMLYLATDVNGNEVPLNPAAPNYEQRIRAFVGYILASPQAQKQ